MERLIRFFDAWNNEIWINPAMVASVTQERTERQRRIYIELSTGKTIALELEVADVLRRLGVTSGSDEPDPE